MKKITFLLLCMFLCWQNYSQINPIGVSGFTEDVIANGVGPMDESTTMQLDSDVFCYLSEDWKLNEDDPDLTVGLPSDGLISSPVTTGLTYQIPTADAPYEGNNSLRIGESGSENGGAFTLTTPLNYSNLYVLVVSGNGSSTMDITVHFVDGTTQEFTGVSIPDWFQTGLPVEASGIGRGDITNNNVETPFGNPKLFQLKLAISALNQTKNIESVDFVKTNTTGDSVFNAFAISGEETPDCILPSNPSNTALSANSLTFSWEAASIQDTWEVALVESGEDAPESGTEVSETSYEFDSLEANTNYDFYVRSNCGTDGYSVWVGPYAITTACDLVTGLNENFDSSSTLSQCWDTANDQWYINTFGGYSPSNRAYLAYSQDDYLITEQFVVEANTNDRLDFWTKKEYTFYDGSVEVLLSTSGKEVANFTESLMGSTNVGTSWQHYSIDLTDYVGETVFIAFHGVGSLISIDDVMTTPIPLCSSPTGLKAENVLATSANLTWDEGEVSAWEIAVQPYGGGEPESGETVTTNSYEATIDPETIYEFYVRAECSGDGFSPWAGPYSFGDHATLEPTSEFTDDVVANGIGSSASTTTNDIDGGNYVFLSEDYQNTASDELLGYGLPANGDIESQNTPGLHFQMSPFDDPYEGNNSLRIETVGEEAAEALTFEDSPNAQTVYIALTSAYTCFVAGTITFDDGSTIEIPETFVPNWYNGNILPVAISGMGRINTENDNAENPSDNPRIYQLSIDIAFENQSKSISEISLYKVSGEEGILTIFGASVQFPSSCPNPTGLAISDLTFNTVNVNWAGGDETEWEIKYGGPGFDPNTEGDTLTDDDGTPGTTIEGLTENTDYEVYVRAICGATSESEWVGPIGFYTGYCVSEPVINDNNGITNFQIGNTDFPNEDVTYTDFTDTPVDIDQAVMANVQISYATGYAYWTNIWIDLNDDLVFDASELMYSGESSNNNPTVLDASFIVPEDAPLGNHSMRIGGADSGQQPPNPCYSGYYGVTADFTVNILPPPEPPLNDNIVGAINLELDAECTGNVYSNVVATAEVGEPIGSCFVPSELVDHSVWFTFIAPEVGAVEITTDIDPSNFDSQIAVYAAPSDINDITTLTEEIACNQDIVVDENTTSFIELVGLTAGETYYIQVDGKETAQGNFCITVNEISCPDPSNIDVTDIMGNSAQVNWVANGLETEWEIEYGPAGFVLGSGTLVTDTDGEPGYLLTELSIDTAYEVYVSAICDEGSGNPVGPVSFTTPPCPENIEVLATEGICGAIVIYSTPESSEGGSSGNLIVNPDGSEGLDGWTVEENGGSGWVAGESGFITSYATCTKSQIIVLADMGFANDQMDSQPEITISEDYVGSGGNIADTYFLNVELRDIDGNEVASFESGNITTTGEVQTISHTFSDYGPGVRSIYFSHGGSDAEFWTGNFGSRMTNAQVLVGLPEIIVEQTEGIASGEEFPVGTTTNIFEITQGDEEPLICSFDVTVLDVEGPETLVNDITVEMNESLMVSLSPEDIDAGSVDNCEIETMSLDIVSLNCDNLGENEVTLTVIDVNGNTTTATAVVTLTDPNEYCDLSVNPLSEKLSVEIYPNPVKNKITAVSRQEGINEIQIFSLDGQLVMEFKLNDQRKFTGDLSQLSSGVYFIKVHAESGNTSIKKIIKE